MLAILGLLTILTLLWAVMSKRLSALVALILIPVIAALLAGFTTEIITFITDGLQSIAATGVMFIFAILFFGILTDAGTFRPIINRLISFSGTDPVIHRRGGPLAVRSAHCGCLPVRAAQNTLGPGSP